MLGWSRLADKRFAAKSREFLRNALPDRTSLPYVLIFLVGPSVTSGVTLRSRARLALGRAARARRFQLRLWATGRHYAKRKGKKKICFLAELRA